MIPIATNFFLFCIIGHDKCKNDPKGSQTCFVNNRNRANKFEHEETIKNKSI